MADAIIGISVPLSKSLVGQVKAVSPNLDIRELAPLVQREAKSSEARAQLEAHLREIEILFYVGSVTGLISRTPKLRWAHCHSAGVEGLFGPSANIPPFLVTNTTQVVDIPIAEHCFMFMLNFVKHSQLYLQRQQRHSYQRQLGTTGFLEGKTLGILGMGGIGGEVARLGKAFHMRVMATKRTAIRESNVGNADELFPPEQIHTILRESDFIVVSLPLTQHTIHYLSQAEFEAMKPSAFLVNVGRGELIDEKALVEALTTGNIAGAGLDVFEGEPLSSSSPLWDMPNVQISPHVAGSVTDKTHRATWLFCENLKRYLDGQPLLSVVDPNRGY